MARKSTVLKKQLSNAGKRLKAQALAEGPGTPAEGEGVNAAVERLGSGGDDFDRLAETDAALQQRAKHRKGSVVPGARARPVRLAPTPASPKRGRRTVEPTPSAEGKTAAPLKVKFTDKFLQSPCDPITRKPLVLPTEGARLRIWDTLTLGLGLRITSSGAKSFFVVRRVKGKGKAQLSIVLGSYPDMSLAEARDRADDLIRDFKKGVDPREHEAEERKAKIEKAKTEEPRKANLFSGVAETFIKRYVATKRTAGPIAQLVRRRLISRWGDKPITDIDRGNVIAMVEEIAEQSPSAAHQALAYARLLFDWAIERDIYGLKSSPCYPIKIDRLIPDLPESRQRVLDDEEIRLVWRAAWPSADAESVYPVGLLPAA